MEDSLRVKIILLPDLMLTLIPVRVAVGSHISLGAQFESQFYHSLLGKS